MNGLVYQDYLESLYFNLLVKTTQFSSEITIKISHVLKVILKFNITTNLFIYFSLTI